MGHYASEMSCSKCGKIRCTCPVVKEKKGKWVVDSQSYKAIKESKLVEKLKKVKKGENSLSWMMRTRDIENRMYWAPHYFTKDEATDAGARLYIEHVKSAKQNLTKVEKKIPGTVTTAEKIEMYEKLLHDIQMFAAVTMDGKKVQKLIDNICSWSYAHRCGNGENSDDEQQGIIDNAFKKLRDQ